MKKIWAIRKDAEAVSPVIATILMVAITVVLAAVLYVMVLGFGGTSKQTPTASLVSGTPVPSYGKRYDFASMQPETSWDSITIQLQDDTGHSVQWAAAKASLTGSGLMTQTDTAGKVLGTGTLTVWCNITDLSGNGAVSGGDYFTFTTGSATADAFAAGHTYTVNIIYDDNGAKICSASWVG